MEGCVAATIKVKRTRSELTSQGRKDLRIGDLTRTKRQALCSELEFRHGHMKRRPGKLPAERSRLSRCGVVGFKLWLVSGPVASLNVMMDLSEVLLKQIRCDRFVVGG